MLQKILEWDRDLFIYLNSLGIEQLDGFWSFVTDIYTWIPLFIFFFYLLFKKFGSRDGLLMTATVILLFLFVITMTDLVKEYVARLRPNNETEINTLIRILKSPTNFSFWSGHAASSVSITTLVYLFVKDRFRWAWLFYIWPIIFATSRIYVGVHYPVDILVGAFVGFVSAWFFYFLFNRLVAPYLGSARHEPAG